MTQTSNRFFDEMARLMNDAAGVAQGVRREFDTLLRNQAERMLRDLDVVKREEFEAVKEMARLAREENEALAARSNMVRVVAALHDPSSQLLRALIRALSDGKLCVVDISQMRGAQGLALAGVIFFVYLRIVQPAYFKGQVLNRATPTLVPED